MEATLLIHITAGGLGLVAGYVALYARKGAPLHRRAGLVFVCAMLTMCVAATVIAAARRVEPAINIPAAVVTAYLVTTALTTVRPPSIAGRRLDLAAMLVALPVGVATVGFGLEAVAAGGSRDGMPAFPFFLIGVVAVLGVAGDFRILRSGALRGARRVARHLWRMSFALFIAAMSFFLGQADEFPAMLRIPALLGLPVLAVLGTMLYWLWRVRIRGILRGLVVGRVGAAESA